MSIAGSTVCVIGGGISGLVTAYELAKDEPRPRVVLCEASGRLGGSIRTDTFEDVAVEAGADSFLTRDAAAVELCAELGLEDDLVAPAVFGAVIWSRGRLLELPRDLVFGMPASARAALRARPLSVAGRARAALEPVLPGPRLGHDVGVGKLVERRFGRQVRDRLVDPLLAGTRAGRPDEMSLRAALPAVWSAANGKRSITRALGSARAGGAIAAGPPPFKSVAGGLQRLVEALRAASTGVELWTAERVRSVTAESEWGARVVTANDALDCTAVIVATPAHEAARLLATARPAAARLMGTIESSSVATIALAYPPGAGAPPAGTSGLLVPSSEGKTMSACTWYSVKWPQARPADGGLVLRCFVGRAGDDPAMDLDDDALVARVASEAGDALGLAASPREAAVTRWPRSLPQYTVGHSARVDDIERLLGESPGIWATGGSYRGSGLPDCIRHARTTAASVLRWLRTVS